MVKPGLSVQISSWVWYNSSTVAFQLTIISHHLGSFMAFQATRTGNWQT